MAEKNMEREIAAPVLPFWTRVKYGLITFLIQRVISASSILMQDLRAYFKPSLDGPDIRRSYPARRDLYIRIFLPQNKPRETGYQTLFTIHGGGFVLGRSADDDSWNRTFSSRHDILVIALDYRKAPSHPFPTAIHDLTEVISFCLADNELPIDRTRGVAIAGFSAGGTLALSVGQILHRSEKVPLRAVIPMYPALDFAVPLERKVKARRHKPALGGLRATTSDVTARIAPIFDWAYIPAGINRCDPLLSPMYGTDSDAYAGFDIFIVACELDRLANEAWRLASTLAGRTVPGLDESVGGEKTFEKGELILDDARFAFKGKIVGGGSCRWLLVPDTVHGYDSLDETEIDDKDMLEDARSKANKVIDIVGQWLLEASE